MYPWNTDELKFDESTFAGTVRLFLLPELVMFPHVMQPLNISKQPYLNLLNDALDGDGLLALWRRCPHLGCTVPWKSGFNYEGDKGWFRCPCHGSTYTKAGVRVFGPATRSMDTMHIEVDDAGNITVNTGDITFGGADNPRRAQRS